MLHIFFIFLVTRGSFFVYRFQQLGYITLGYWKVRKFLEHNYSQRIDTKKKLSN